MATMFFTYAGAVELALLVGLGSIIVAIMLLMLVRQIIGQIAPAIRNRQDEVEASLGY